MTRHLYLLLLVVAASCTPPQRAPQSQSLRVVSYNIKHGRGNDDKVDLERTASVLRTLKADIVALQEVDNHVTRSNNVAQADSLGTLLRMHHAFGGFFAYQGGEYGMAVLSKFPIARVTPIRLPDGNEPRIALRVDVTTTAVDTVAVFNVHFDWVANDTFRFKQASALAQILDTVSMRYMVVGDYNDGPESRTLSLFRAKATEALKPSHDRMTFSSTKPEREIDHLFVAPATAWSINAVRVIHEPMASDHRPVLVELALFGFTGANGDLSTWPRKLLPSG